MSARPVLVIGAGSWGTALALVLARNGCRVTLTGRSPEALEELRTTRLNTRHLPGVPLPETIDIRSAPEAAEILVLAVPCQALRTVLKKYSAAADQAQAICITCKGIEHDSLCLPHEVARQCVPRTPAALLSGPTFASEVARRLPSAATVAAARADCRKAVSGLFHGEFFRVYQTSDLVGVALGGALKNVIAIAAGASDGLGFGHNARAALIARGLAEITRLGQAMGAAPETLAGLAGLGDLVLTCTGNESRNYRFGRLLAEGLDPRTARRRIASTIEGIHTVTACGQLARKHQVEMPVAAVVDGLVTGTVTAHAAVRGLLARKPSREFY